jgi:hypothetical protein
MRKKVIFSSILIIAFFLIYLLVVVYKPTNECIEIKEPDRILIYYSGNILEVKKDNNEFYDIYVVNNDRLSNRTFISETSISNDDISSIKSKLAVEYIFYESQTLIMEDVDRSYTKLLFALDGLFEEHMIIYSSGEYRSGPVSNLKKGNKVKDIVKNLIH